jgi:hypothetical protein
MKLVGGGWFATADKTQPLLHDYAFIIAHRLSFSSLLSLGLCMFSAIFKN